MIIHNISSICQFTAHSYAINTKVKICSTKYAVHERWFYKLRITEIGKHYEIFIKNRRKLYKHYPYDVAIIMNISNAKYFQSKVVVYRYIKRNFLQKKQLSSYSKIQRWL